MCQYQLHPFSLLTSYFGFAMKKALVADMVLTLTRSYCGAMYIHSNIFYHELGVKRNTFIGNSKNIKPILHQAFLGSVGALKKVDNAKLVIGLSF